MHRLLFKIVLFAFTAFLALAPPMTVAASGVRNANRTQSEQTIFQRTLIIGAVNRRHLRMPASGMLSGFAAEPLTPYVSLAIAVSEGGGVSEPGIKPNLY